MPRQWHVRESGRLEVSRLSGLEGHRPVEDAPIARQFPLTADNVRNRSYPLSRDAYIYVNKAPGPSDGPESGEFIRFVLSREGQQIVQKAGIYSPLPPPHSRAAEKARHDDDCKSIEQSSGRSALHRS